MKKFFLLFLLTLFALIPLSGQNSIQIDQNQFILKGVSLPLRGSVSSEVETLSIIDDHEAYPINITDGKFQTDKMHFTSEEQVFLVNGKKQKINIELHSAWISLIPPLLALTLAFIIKDVFISLFLGIFSGALLLNGYNPFKAFFYLFNDLFIKVISSPGNIRIMIFTLTMGALILLMRKAGGIQDLVNRITRYIKTPRSGMVATFFAGIVIFFDDYANALMIGSAVRPITDKLRISREKLSFLIDGTSAPVASIAPVSTWVGYEITVLFSAYMLLDLTGTIPSGYSLFLKTYPFRFYTILMLLFTFLIAYLDRDYGPMAKAEERARIHGQPLAYDATPMTDKEISTEKEAEANWLFAIIPILTVIGVIVYMLLYTGYQSYPGNFAADLTAPSSIGSKLKLIIALLEGSQTSASLVLGPSSGIIVFVIMAKIKGIFTFKRMANIFVAGAKFVLFAVFVIVFAWSIGTICKEVHTAHFLVSILSDTLSPRLIPLLGFLLSAVIAFATGTSYGTMAIMFPIIIPLSYELSRLSGLPADLASNLLFASMGSILAGACFGDHCSPISDTTLFSSLSSGADHLHHVKTQLPYALTVAAISVLFGYLPIGYGISPWICLPVSAIVMFLVIMIIGKKNPKPEDL